MHIRVVVCAVLLALSSACVSVNDQDLHVDAIYLADRSQLPDVREAVRQGYIQPIGLAIELSTLNRFLLGAYDMAYFCDGPKQFIRFGDVGFYSISTDTQQGGLSHYLTVLDLKTRDRRPSGDPFDFTKTTKDLCLYAFGSGTYFRNRTSETRIPNAVIRRALAGGVHPLPLLENGR